MRIAFYSIAVSTSGIFLTMFAPFRLLILDPRGDSHGNDDIVELSYVSDEDYLYLGVGYGAHPENPGLLLIEIDMTGDGQTNTELFMNNIWTFIHDWTGYLCEGDRLDAPQIGFADAIDAGKMIELRMARRFLLSYLDGPCFRVRMTDFTRDWVVEDSRNWVTLWESPETPLSITAFQLLDCGVVEEESEPLTILGKRSVVGEYDASGSYTPYLRKNPGRLLLTPRGRYRVCFDYRILKPHPEGFEVLFFTPTTASKNECVRSLRTNGKAGEMGHACLDGQLLDYCNYEIRWNIVATGAIAIDNVVITNLESGEVVAEEDFESW